VCPEILPDHRLPTTSPVLSPCAFPSPKVDRCRHRIASKEYCPSLICAVLPSKLFPRSYHRRRKVTFLFADGGHKCETVRDAGFSGKDNGDLLALAEEHFDVLVTIDKNNRYQQNMTGRNIAS
jgi:hypothetical protein